MRWVVFLYLIFFLILLVRERRSKTPRYVYQTVLFFFLSGSIASIWLIFKSDDFENIRMSLEAVIYHISLLWLLISPLRNLEKDKKVTMIKSSDTILMPFTVFVITMMLIYIFTGIQDVSLSALATESQELRDNLDVDYYEGNGFLSYVAYYAKIYSVVPLVLVFYYIKFKPKNQIIIYLLLFCSLGTAILSLREAAREYIIKVLFVAFCLYLLLKDNNINTQWRRKLRRIFIVLGGLAVALFVVITIARFTLTRDIDATESSIAYLGQGFLNFSEKYVNYPDGLHLEKGKRVFPIIFGNPTSDIIKPPKHFRIRLDVFSTGIGTWLGDCGSVLTVIMVLLFNYLFRIVGRIKEMNVFTLIYYALIYEMIFSLLFFFHGAWNIGKVSSIILLICLDILCRKVKYGKIVYNNPSI